MKSVIKTIMDKQGINKAELLRQTKLYKIDRIPYDEKCQFNEREVSLLHFLFRKPSNKVSDLKEPFIVKHKGKDYLNVVACLPRKTQTGFNLYAKKYADRVSVWYQTRTRARSEFTFKSLISLDTDFVTYLGLSLGDGLNNPSKRNTHYVFTNTNFHLTYLIFKWLKDYFGLNAKFQLFLNIPIIGKFNINIQSLESKFNQKITVYRLKRYRNPTLTLQISNRIFQCLHSIIFNKLKQTILHRPVFRRAFLKGLFAAEGHVKHSVYGTIESISFSFNPKLEIDLMNFVHMCLKKENIHSKIDPGGLVYFCGYDNMIKFYLIRALSLHKDKENKFLKLIKNSKITLHLKQEYLKPLREYSQNQIANQFGCSQSTVCKSLKENFLSLNYLYKAQNLLNVSYESLMRNTEALVVGTLVIRDRRIIRFLLSACLVI